VISTDAALLNRALSELLEERVLKAARGAVIGGLRGVRGMLREFGGQEIANKPLFNPETATFFELIRRGNFLPYLGVNCPSAVGERH
jgi:hypothetical protein